MSFRSLWRVNLWLATSLLFPAGWPLCAELPQFEDPLEVFEPRQAATETEQDRTQAMIFYGMAREAEGRGDSVGALRSFQRALRYDPACTPAARAAVRLAIQLERPDQAVEASLRLSECQEEDRLPLRYVALHLTRQGDWEKAVEIYERTLGIGPREPASDEDVVMMMEMARLCRLIEDNKKAASYFTQALTALDSPRKHNISPKVKNDLLGDDGATYQLIGSSFLAAGDVAAAESVFKKAEEAAPSAARTAFNTAAILRHTGRFEEALVQLDACLEAHTEAMGLGPFLLLEETLDELDRGGELLSRIAAWHEKQPDNKVLGYFLAEKSFAGKQFDRAEQLYARLIEKSPTSTAYERLLEIYLSRNDYAKVAEVLSAVVAKTGSLDALGDSLALLTESAAAVDAVISRGDAAASRGDRSDRSYTLAAALVSLDAERFDSAERLMKSSIASSPDQAENLLLIWGIDLMSADRNQEAVRVFREGVEREGVSDDQRALFNHYLAGALELGGQTDSALQAAREAVKLDEESAPFHARVAWVLFHADRLEEAAKEYRSLIDRFDGDVQSDLARGAVRQARMVLATMCVEQRRIDEAVEWLEQVLDEFVQDPGALNDLGYLWADENQHLERAQRMIEQAVESEPENAAYRDSLGWVLFRRGRFDEAVAELTRAAAMEPDPVVLEHLGDAFSKTGQADKAKATWERAAAEFQQAEEPGEAARIREKIAGSK